MIGVMTLLAVLSGLWSFSVTYEVRVVFRFHEGDRVVFVDIGDHDTVKFPAFFMAPEQVNFGLYLYKGEEDDAWQLNSEEEEAERKR